MSSNKKLAFISLFVGIAVAIALFAVVGPMRLMAGTFDFAAPCRLAAATSSVSYITPGAATTTLTCPIAVGSAPASSASLMVEYTASSSASSQMAINLEYSQDGVDWFENNLSNLATTSAVASLQTVQKATWIFASSTPGQGIAATNVRAHKIVNVPTPARYVRAIFTVPVGAGNGAVWAQLVPVKEI